MNKPPAFQFYPKDFLSDFNVATMSMEERGVYITLLSHCWLEGWLPIGSTKLQRICGNPSNWEEIWESVKPCFYEKDGKLYHKRLDQEREKQQEWQEKSRKGGLQSAEKRKDKKKSKGGSRVVKPPLNDPTNQKPTLQSSSSSAYCSNSKEEESAASKINFNFENRKWENIGIEDLKLWKKTYPACSIEHELDLMADWLLSNPSKRKKNYRRFISNWLTRAQERGGSKIHKPDMIGKSDQPKKEIVPDSLWDKTASRCSREAKKRNKDPETAVLDLYVKKEQVFSVSRFRKEWEKIPGKLRDPSTLVTFIEERARRLGA